MSPTITTPAMTQAGMILGTAAYMTPEQARGKAVDKRADIWAFGAVLFEMLTGQRAFPGEDVTRHARGGREAEPEWDARCRADVPASVRQVLRVCLQKDPRQRLQAHRRRAPGAGGRVRDGRSADDTAAPSSAPGGRLAGWSHSPSRARGRGARHSRGAASARDAAGSAELPLPDRHRLPIRASQHSGCRRMAATSPTSRLEDKLEARDKGTVDS